jgi:hypothetical protein
MKWKEIRNAYKILIKISKEKRRPVEETSVDGRIILRCILEKEGMRMWTGFILLRIGFSNGLF